MTDNELFVSITRDPNDWEVGTYHAKYIPTGTTWWIANGFLFFYPSGGPSLSLPFYVRWQLWQWLKLLPLRQKGIIA